MTDTGAGTPLTAIEEIALRNLAHVATSSDLERLTITAGELRRLLATVDAARSRPATDPAGLDAAALLRQFVNEGRIRHRLNPRCNELMPMDGTCTCGLREAERLVRLSVADGPGPAHEGPHDFDGREWCRLCDLAGVPRPATDPAGLDVVQEFTERLLALAQQDVSARGGGEFAKGRRNAAEDVLNELRRVRRVAARLAVADGPGPEAVLAASRATNLRRLTLDQLRTLAEKCGVSYWTEDWSKQDFIDLLVP